MRMAGVVLPDPPVPTGLHTLRDQRIRTRREGGSRLVRRGHGDEDLGSDLRVDPVHQYAAGVGEGGADEGRPVPDQYRDLGVDVLVEEHRFTHLGPERVGIDLQPRAVFGDLVAGVVGPPAIGAPTIGTDHSIGPIRTPCVPCDSLIVLCHLRV